MIRVLSCLFVADFKNQTSFFGFLCKADFRRKPDLALRLFPAKPSLTPGSDTLLISRQTAKRAAVLRPKSFR
jgi:hypothetical protein